jgi:hypothetical protein
MANRITKEDIDAALEAKENGTAGARLNLTWTSGNTTDIPPTIHINPSATPVDNETVKATWSTPDVADGGTMKPQPPKKKRRRKLYRSEDVGAGETWEQEWHEAMPLSGVHKYVIHMHVTDADSVADIDQDVQKLAKGKLPRHYDVRLETDRFSGYWGFSADDVTKDGATATQLKAFGPSYWLDVDDKLVKSGNPGNPRFSRFVKIDEGTWHLESARSDLVEMVFDGGIFKGRYRLYEDEGWNFAGVGDRSVLDEEDFGDVIEKLAKKGEIYCFWPVDADHPERGLRQVDVTKEAEDLTKITVLKSEEDRRYTLGVAYPVYEIDAHGDYADETELERTAWNYLRKYANSGLMHRDGTDGAGDVVESYIYRGPDWQIGDQTIVAGDWMLGVVWGEEAWNRIKKGELTGFSIQGTGKRKFEDRFQGSRTKRA